MFVLICEYTGSRYFNPLDQFPRLEVVGPFAFREDVYAYEESHRWESCVQHSVVPLVDPGVNQMPTV